MAGLISEVSCVSYAVRWYLPRPHGELFETRGRASERLGATTSSFDRLRMRSVGGACDEGGAVGADVGCFRSWDTPSLTSP